jgi:hypothetical protein
MTTFSCSQKDYILKHLNRNAFQKIIKSNLDINKTRYARNLKSSVTTEYQTELDTHNHKNVSFRLYSFNNKKNKSVHLEPEETYETMHSYKNHFKDFFDLKVCIKHKKKSFKSDKLPTINRIRYNFIESIEENLDDEIESPIEHSSVSRNSNQTSDPTRKYLSLLPTL